MHRMSLITQFMKHAVIELLIFASCVFVSQGQTRSPGSKPPSEWSLSITSEGAPWTKKFNVQLNESGLLLFAEEDPAKMPDDPVTKLTRLIRATELRQVYEQAFRSVQKGTNSNRHWAEGTWVTIELRSNGRAMFTRSHLGEIEQEAPEIAKLFALINKHLPKEHQVY